MLKGIDPLLGPDLLALFCAAWGTATRLPWWTAIIRPTDAQRLVRMDGHDAPRIVGPFSQ